MTASVKRACVQRRTWLVVQGLGLAVLAAAAAISLVPGHAFASGPSVTMPSGPFTNGQQITISGTGFPTRSQNPAGLQIIECADPGGTTANLPTDSSTCDGTTVNPLPVLTDSSGNFSTSYNAVQLEMSSGGVVDCDATNYCVLWVGVDYVNDFTGTHAFSTAFLFQQSSTTTTAATTTTSAGATTTTTETGATTTTETGATTTTETGATTTTETGATTTTSTTSPTSTSTTSPTSTSTTSPSGSTTTTSSASTSTTSGTGTSTTAAGATGGSGGTTGTSTPTGGTGSGSGTVSSGSGNLAFTGTPPVLPWLVVMGVGLTILGGLGRRLIPRRAP